MSETVSNPERRDFLKKASAVGIGTAIIAIPLGAGLAVLLDPLRRRSSGAGQEVLVTTLDAVPNDGIPRKFTVIASRTDAWNKLPSAAIGAVYLRRTGEKTVEALNVVCPHAGCFVDYRREQKDYYCPCHNSSFQLSGQIADKKSPAPRGMDPLAVEVRNDKEVWVKFQNFLTGHPQRIPVA